MDFMKRIPSNTRATQKLAEALAPLHGLHGQFERRINEMQGIIQKYGLAEAQGGGRGPVEHASAVQAFQHEFGNLPTQVQGYLVSVERAKPRAAELKDHLISALRHRPIHYLPPLDKDIERYDHLPVDVKDRVHSLIGDIESLCDRLAEKLGDFKAPQAGMTPSAT